MKYGQVVDVKGRFFSTLQVYAASFWIPLPMKAKLLRLFNLTVGGAARNLAETDETGYYF